MGFTSRVSRVWGIGIVDRLCRLKLDLEAVVEDANEEVYSFQIKRSLIYLKFVGGCTSISYYHRIIHKIDFFYQKSLSRRDYISKSYHTQPCLGIITKAFICIFNSGYTL